MKRYLPFFMASLIVLSVFSIPGNPVKAAGDVQSAKQFLKQNGWSCGCPDTIPVLGAEKNKIVADLLSSDEFKNEKEAAISRGFFWRGADTIQVERFGQDGPIGVVVPFYSQDGTIEGFAFLNGHYLFDQPMF